MIGYLKHNAGLAVLVLGVPLSVLLILVVLDPGFQNGYAAAGTAAATLTIDILGPLAAGGAAYEGARLRDMRQLNRTAVRGSRAVLARHFLPVVLAAAVGFVAALVCLGLLTDLGLFLPDWRGLAVAFLALIAYTAVGSVVGWCITAAISVPLVVCVCYLWIVLTPATSVGWLRHLTGDISGCCASTEQVAAPVIGAIAVLTAGCALAAVAVVGARVSVLRIGAAVTAIALAVPLAVTQVAGMSAKPAQDRSTALVCIDVPTKVCLWPEHRALLAPVSLQVQQVRHEMAAAGITVPDTVSEKPGSAWVIGFGPESTNPEVLRRNLIMGLLNTPELHQCKVENPDVPVQVPQDHFVLQAYLMSQAGFSAQEIEQRIWEESAREQADKVAQMTAAQRGRWFEAARSAYRSCRR